MVVGKRNTWTSDVFLFPQKETDEKQETENIAYELLIYFVP